MKNLLRTDRVVVLGLIMALVLSACSAPAAPKSATTSTAVPAPASKPASTPTGPYGELRLASASFSGGILDPARAASGAAGNLVAPMFDFLFTGDTKGKLAAGIVEKWEMGPDGLSWDYHIRKGVKFHNGDDLTARDVKFTLDRYNSPEAATADIRNMVARVDVVDEYTVRAYTKDKQPYLPYVSWNLSTLLGATMPKAYIEKNGVEYFTQHPVGSGPFKFVRYVAGDMVEYEAVNSHWRQVPAFKKLTNILVPEEATRAAALKTGAVDVIEAEMETSRTLEKDGLRGVAVDYIYPGYNLFGAYDPAGASTPIANIKVRQALSLAINREEVMKTFFFGKASPPPPPVISEVSDGIDFAFWMDYASKIYRYDPVEAKKLLGEAGYPNGFSMKLYSLTMAGASYLPKLAEVVQGYWLKIGVKAELVPVEQGTLLERADTYKSPIMIGQATIWRYPGGRPATPRELLNNFHSTLNRWHYLGKTDPELDKLIVSSMSEMDPVKRGEMITKAVKIATDSLTMVYIAGAPAMVVIGPQVDFDSPPHAFGLGQLAEVTKHRK